LSGFLVTLLVTLALAHVTPVVVPGWKNVAFVPILSGAFRIAPTATAGPPTLPIVRTWGVAADAYIDCGGGPGTRYQPSAERFAPYF
jgi:hypothetical protein